MVSARCDITLKFEEFAVRKIFATVPDFNARGTRIAFCFVNCLGNASIPLGKGNSKSRRTSCSSCIAAQVPANLRRRI